jgi:dTMP kinase
MTESTPVKPGVLISFEGIEGSGKTTQVQKVATYLYQSGYAPLLTKEPGGTHLGLQIRSLILDPATRFSSPLTELLLFSADRVEHVAATIRPALNGGQIVLCDRYIDSTRAYQIGGRKNSPKLVEELCQIAELIPDLTILFDLDPEIGITRARSRASLDRFEQETLAFHKRVRENYLQTAASEPDRFRIIKVGQRDPDAIFKEVIPHIQSVLK